MEKSLVLIKPDAVEKNIVGSILKCYEDYGLKIVALRIGKVEKEFAEIHYKEHIGKSFYENLIDFITRSPLCAVVLEGDNCIDKVREINGSTNPKDQKEGTIRKMYATNMTENAVHASDSIESANREIDLWFPEFNDIV